MGQLFFNGIQNPVPMKSGDLFQIGFDIFGKQDAKHAYNIAYAHSRVNAFSEPGGSETPDSPPAPRAGAGGWINPRRKTPIVTGLLN